MHGQRRTARVSIDVGETARARARSTRMEPHRHTRRARDMPRKGHEPAPCAEGGNGALFGGMRIFLMTIRHTLSTAFRSARGYPRLSTGPCLPVTARK